MDAEEDISFDLGDRVYVQGGRLDGLRGRIYYLDPELMRILPDGVSDRLVDIPIVDGDLDPELGIEAYYSLTKRTNPAFVAQLNAHAEMTAETFSSSGEPGPKYTIKAVNEREDKLLLEDETGASLEVEFNFIGIPRDLPFAVLRPRQPPIETKGLTEEEEAAVEAIEVDEFEDILEEQLAEEPVFEDPFVIKEIPAAERYYPDLVQRNDMMRDLLVALSPAAQKNPANQKAIRALVEQCVSLRNAVVSYSSAGQPIGQLQTSFLTLGDVVDAVPVPLARPVLDAKRVLYLDHSEDGQVRMEAGLPSQDPDELPGRDLEVKYLADTIQGANEYMDTQLGGIAGQGIPDSLPAWFLSWNTLNTQFHSTWVSKGGSAPTQFREDKEFFRAPVPDMETPQVDVLDARGADKRALITADFLGKTTIGLQRALGPRSTRLKQKEGLRRVESGEEGVVVNTLLFPLSEQRNLGATRSGILARDIALAQQFPQSALDILERLDGIPETATAGGILSIGPGGNTLGNIPLEDWLRAQPLYPLGLADALVDLANYGLSQAEFNADQYDVLVARIDTYRALIKQYILELADASAKSFAELQTAENPFLTAEAATDILNALKGEPILQERMKELGGRIPAYRGNDIAMFAGLFAAAADLVIATLAAAPVPLARERNRKVRDQFLETLREAMARATKAAEAGQAPEPNPCEHVADYTRIKKVKDDADRMKLLARFLADYRGAREGNWVNCGVCSQHLMCYHEVLLIQEFLHPREKDTLHKELLLTFSGGQFHGQFMCRNCGQGIADLELDNSMEFDDDGKPMSGSAVLEDADQAQKDVLDNLLGASITEVEEVEFKTDTQTAVYGVARRLADMVGITLPAEAHQRIVSRVESELLRQPSRSDYAAATKGRKAVDYDILINRILVCSTAANCLVEIQTAIPGIVMRYRMPGCRAGFSGYPTGNEKDKTGVEYLACAVSGVRDNSAPWTLTGYQRESNEQKRREAIVGMMEKLLAGLVTNAAVQQQIRAKREHLEKIYGSAIMAEQLPERLPAGFLPAPVLMEEEEVKRAAIVPAAATPLESIRAWILQAHAIGKASGNYTKGSLTAEAICCETPIQAPGVFWREKVESMAPLPLKEPPRGPVRGHLAIHFKARPQPRLEAIISPDVLYRIFLKVCYTGPRMGLRHEPGHTNTCPYCGFTFPESPYVPQPLPPMSSDPKTQREMMKAYTEEVDAIVTKGKVALETQRVEVNQRTFEELVDTTHMRFAVEPPKRVIPEAGMRLVERLRSMEPEPFEGWRAVMTATIERLATLPPGAEDLDVAEAYGPMSNMAMELLEEFKGRLGAENTDALRKVLESPTQATESLWTYVLIPFQRLINSFVIGSLKVQKSYKLGPGTDTDLNRLIADHLAYLAPLAKRATGFTLHKMRWARDRLSAAFAVLRTSIRGSLIPGGNLGLPYLTTALLGGILAEFMNPNVVPPGGGEDAAAVDMGARAPIQVLDVCIQRMRLEGLNFTSDQVRELINRRNDIEKTSFIGRFHRLTPEEKQMELRKKKLGLGEWAVGGTKAIYAYDPEQYERERQQRLDMGFQDFMPAGAPGVVGGEPVLEDGYDVIQVHEDDA